MKDRQVLEEKWFKFQRILFKDGYIDRYVGDQAADPNLDKKPYINLNTIKVWLRLNGEGEWKQLQSSYPFSTYSMDTFRKDFTAKEIWDEIDYYE